MNAAAGINPRRVSLAVRDPPFEANPISLELSQNWPQANGIGTESTGREVAINSDKSMKVDVLETAQNEEQKVPGLERTDMIH